jgi:hypothetical protein
MDQIDAPTLFALNLVLLVAVCVFLWGASALLVAALIGTPLALGTIVFLSLTAKA